MFHFEGFVVDILEASFNSILYSVDINYSVWLNSISHHVSTN